ncbi:MAG TPA: Ig-like domain repeat protein [Marmoricola sp.]
MHRFGRALGALVATALVSAGLSTTLAAPAQAEPAGPQRALDLCLPLVGCLPEVPGLPDVPDLPGLPQPDQFPQLTGLPVVGEVLTLTEPVWNLLPGDLLSTDVTWLCNGTPIPGTEDVWTYVPTEAQAGCLMTAQVVTTVLGFLPLTMVTDALAVAGIGETAVTPNGAPTIKADKGGKTGTTLSVSLAASWKQEDVKTTYQWLRNGQPIDGKTGTQYLLTKDDVDQSISARAIGKKDGMADGVSTSNALTGQLGDALVATRQPTIGGTPAVGRTLTVDPGSWGTGETPTYTYQWRRDASDIAGATAATHVVTTDDVGHTLTVVVTATRPGYLPGSFRTAGATVAAAKAASTLTASLSRKVVKKGRAATLTLVLTAVGVSAPSGPVTVLDGTKVLKRVSLAAGKATLRLKKLKPGVHKIKAVYAGSDTVLGATSKVVKLTVKKAKKK